MSTLGMVRTTDPETSHEAADRVSSHRDTVRMRVYDILLTVGPMSDYELVLEYEKRYGSVPYSTAPKRRGELRDSGLVRDSGRRVTIPTGSSVIVWEAAS